MSSPDDLERLARTAYEAHRHAHPASLPPWEEVTEQEQRAWRAAMSAVTRQGDVTIADSVSVQPLVIDAGDQRQTFTADFTAGRQGTLVVRDEHASGHHARFRFAHGLWHVEDLGSTNGTWLNGHRIFSAQRIKKGDKIRIGRTLLTVVSA